MGYISGPLWSFGRLILPGPTVVSLSLCVSVVEELVDEEAERKKRKEEYVRTYVSPWERAMKGNEELTATMRSCMPGPIQIHAELPLYKSFNRYTLMSLVPEKKKQPKTQRYSVYNGVKYQ